MQFRVFECNNSFHDLDDVLARKRVDILIARVKGLNQMQKLRKIIHANHHTKVVIAGETDRDIIFEYIKAGVKGHLGDDISEGLLKRAVRVLHAGEVWFDREISARVMELYAGKRMSGKDAARKTPLSGREMEVLECVSRGMKNRDIALALHISESTVKTHLYKIYEKLGVKGRMSAVLKMKEW